MDIRRPVVAGALAALAGGCWLIPGPIPQETPLLAGSWLSLTEGGTLEQWRPPGAAGAWTFVDGVLTVTPPDGGGAAAPDLATVREDFANVNVYCEFQVAPGATSGLVLRGQHEVRIADSKGQPRTPESCGALAGRRAPALDTALAAGGWQTLDATVQGRDLTVLLNGHLVLDRVGVGLSGRTTGPLVLRGARGGTVAFRNLRWRRLR